MILISTNVAAQLPESFKFGAALNDANVVQLEVIVVAPLDSAARQMWKRQVKNLTMHIPMSDMELCGKIAERLHIINAPVLKVTVTYPQNTTPVFPHKQISCELQHTIVYQ